MSPVVQWLRLHAPSVGYPSLILDPVSRSHMPQLRSDAAKEIDFFFFLREKPNLAKLSLVLPRNSGVLGEHP